MAAGNTQLDFRTGAARAPHLESALDDQRALAPAGHPELPGHLLPPQRLLIDPLPIVVDGQPQLTRFVVDGYRHVRHPRVRDGIAERLAGNPVRFVMHQRVQSRDAPATWTHQAHMRASLERARQPDAALERAAVWC